MLVFVDKMFKVWETLKMQLQYLFKTRSNNHPEGTTGKGLNVAKFIPAIITKSTLYYPIILPHLSMCTGHIWLSN